VEHIAKELRPVTIVMRIAEEGPAVIQSIYLIPYAGASDSASNVGTSRQNQFRSGLSNNSTNSTCTWNESSVIRVIASMPKSRILKGWAEAHVERKSRSLIELEGRGAPSLFAFPSDAEEYLSIPARLETLAT
jgi:hypothetical protein